MGVDFIKLTYSDFDEMFLYFFKRSRNEFSSRYGIFLTPSKIIFLHSLPINLYNLQFSFNVILNNYIRLSYIHN